MADMEFEGWALKVKTTRSGLTQIECRKTISELCGFGSREINVTGQVLLIVALGGWERNNEVGQSDVRLSMNGTCPMTFDRLESFVRVADRAREILVGLSLKNLTLDEVTTMLGEYYSGSDHAWPILLGKAGTFGAPDGVEQFIIYPKVLGAVNQMNELFEGIGNVEIIQHEMGEINAGPARPGD